MLARTFAVVVAWACVLVGPAFSQQGYAPGRPSFTLGEKLQQWGRGLMGESETPTPATASGGNANSPRTAARPSTQRTSNPPNYHRSANSNNSSSSSNSSSRRTAQPSYQGSAPPKVTMEETADDAPPAPKAALARPAVDRGYAASKYTPPKSAAPRAQPRSLQEALYNSQPSDEPMEEEVAPAPTPKAVANSPVPVNPPNSPKAARPNTEAAPRIVRRPEQRKEEDESRPTLEEPVPTKPATPIASKPAAPSRTTDGLLFAHKSPVLAVEAKGPRRTAVGRETKFRVSLRNTGDVSARDVLLVVQLPAGVEVVSAHPTTGEARVPANKETAPVLRWSVSEVPSRSQEELELLLVPRKSEAIDLVVQWTFAPDTQQVVVDVQEPKLQMHLAGPKEVNFGEKVVYKLTFSNPGDADTENVVVTLPAIGEGEAPADSHAIGTIRAGESKVVEMELVARQMGRLTIRAQAQADCDLQATVAQEVTVRRAGLEIELEGPQTAYARANAGYKVLVTNNGNAAASNVQVAVQLPPRAKYVSSTGGGEANGERVVWTLDSLEAGQQQELQFKCQLENAGANRLQAAAVHGDLKDVAALNTEVEAVADLTLSVVEPEGISAVGEEVTYEIRIKNRGTTSAAGVNVVAFFSDGVEAVSASGARYEITAGRIQFGVIPVIAADKEMVLRIKARADQAGNHVFRAEAQCTALGSKLAQEGTTRFIGSETSASDGAEPQTAAPPSSSKTSEDDASSKWSGSSRRRGALPPDIDTPDTSKDESR